MNDWNWKFSLGIPPSTKAALTPNEMRLTILDASRDSALIRNSLETGRYNGLSGEDIYVQLAYHALRELERQWRLNQRHMELEVSPQTLITPAQNGGEHG